MRGCLEPDEWFGLRDEPALHDHLDRCATCRALAAVLGTAIVPAAPSTGDDPVGLAPELVQPGARLGRFVVRGALGAGGMGVVLEAYDPTLERTVALKVVRRLRDEAGWLRARARVQAEARAMARLAHPNVVAIHELVELDGEQLIAMEHVAGADLATWLASGARTTQERLAVLLGIARGLAAAHDAGIIHRDVKPANVIVDARGLARLTDFGLAALVEQAPSERGGTRGFVAPEVLAGDAADARSDQYAFAVTGELVMAGQGGVAKLLSRARAVDPAARFPSMHALVQALERASRWRSRRGLVAIAGLAVVLGVAAWLATRSSDEPVVIAGLPAGGDVFAIARRTPFQAAFAQVTVLSEVGDYRGALAKLEAIASRLPPEDEALRGELLYRRADALSRVGDTAGSVPVLEEALAIAERARNDVARVNTMILLLGAYQELGRTDESRALATVAEAAIARVPRDLAQAARLGNVLANIAHQAGKLDEAERRYREVIALQRERFGRDANDPEIAGALSNLATVIGGRDDWKEAEALQRQALAMFEATAGKDHPDTALPVAALASIAFERGQHREAVELYTRTVATWERALGAEHPNLSEPLVGLGRAQAALGNHAQATATLRRAEAVATPLGDEHPLHAFAAYRLAEHLHALGTRAGVERLLERSVAGWEASGMSTAEAPGARFLLAQYRWEGKRREEAIALARTARAELAKLELGTERIDAWLASR